MPTLRVLVAYGTMDIGKAVVRAQQAATQGRCTLVLGITRYQAYAGRSAWLVCVSWQGGLPTWVSAHRRKRTANWQVLRATQAIKQLDLTCDTTLLKVLNELAQYGEADLAEWLTYAQAAPP
jgi:hypothetical protein